MLLQELKIENIRSYAKEIILFPEGSTVLTGDIGCGKSSILLAIEFALFGASRPDLQAEALLRKGCNNGTVELKFTLLGKEIIIRRNLKRNNDLIKQTSGYIILDSVKNELTPIELKAKIVALLGYPEEFVTKNKNYIFRYTVYTPQEEMKLILQENEEIRLDALRKIFNIDKYKTIRENMGFYLKDLRTGIAVAQTRTESLDEEKKAWQGLTEEKKQLMKLLEEIRPQLTEATEKLRKQREKLEQQEEQQHQVMQLRQQQKTLKMLISEKETQLHTLNEKEEKITEQIKQLVLEDLEEEKIKDEINEIEKQQNLILQKRLNLREKIKHLQQRIKEIQEEIIIMESELSSQREKEEELRKLTQNAAGKQKLQERKKELEQKIEQVNEFIAKNKALLQQAQEIKEKISSLDQCPLCLQEVNAEHKQKVSEEEKTKIEHAERSEIKLMNDKEEISKEKEAVQNRIEEINLMESRMMRIKAELFVLQEKKESMLKKKQLLKAYAQENNTYVQELGIVNKDHKEEEMQKSLIEKKRQLEEWRKKKIWQEQLQEIIAQKSSAKEKIVSYNLESKKIGEKLAVQEDLSAEITTGKERIIEMSNAEKNFFIKLTQVQTKAEELSKQEEKIKKVVEKMLKEKETLIRYKEIYHWLEEYFLKLTYTIEKQVMVTIHHHFNQLFQEWFSILIDDETVSSRIDDSFSPLIEQNGYEINFSHLSGGEKTSAALAYRLALNKVINDVVHEIKTKDLLILDEPTDGFSSEQLDKVRDVLERLQLRQILIVSHESKIESFVDHVIHVHKEGQVSRIC